MFILVLTPALIATNLLGTVPDNALSAGLRSSLVIVIPAEYIDYVDDFLAQYNLPTLSPAIEITPEFTVTPIPPTPTIVLPTITVTPSSTPLQPTASPTATPTLITFDADFCVDVDALFVRSGPGMVYPVVGWLKNNDCLTVDGRSEGSLWVRISPDLPSFQEYGGMWIQGYYLLPKEIEQLPVVATPAPPSN